MKKLPIYLNALILTLIFILPSSASTTDSAVDLLVQTGERELARGDAAGAIHEFSKALMLNPGHAKARMYLEKFNLEGGLYTGVQTRETQMASLANDVAKYKERMAAMQEERAGLQRRIMLLEDVIERKGDHKLLKDVEDYYRHSAFYEVDATLPRDQQLLALRNKHKDLMEYAFDKDRVQEKYVDVMEDLMGYDEYHLQEARNDLAEYRIALAENSKELLFRMDQLKALTKEFNAYRQRGHHGNYEVQYLQEDLAEANYQVNMLLDDRRVLIIRLEQHLDNMREAL